MTALSDMKKELSLVENAPKKLVIGLLDAGSLINKRIFRRFQELCPDVKLLLVERDQHILERMLSAGKLDMMLSMTPSESTGFEVIPLVEDTFLIALPKTHPISRQHLTEHPDMIDKNGNQVQFPTISLSMCQDVQFVLSGRDRMKVAQMAALRNLPAPNVGFETDSLGSTVSIAAYEPHGAIVPKMFSVLYDGPDKPCFFTCAESLPVWNFALSLKKGFKLSDAGYQYIRLFVNHIQSLGLLSDACMIDSLK
jgi:DNA-binding transcriptional LysR family regulator